MTSDSRALVVHVVYRFAVGGLENGVVNLVNRLPSHSWRHAILSLTDIEPGFAGRVSRSDVEMIAFNKPPGHAFRIYPALYRRIRALAPAIVHTRNLAALEATVPACMARVPVRIHGEHGRDSDDPDGSNVRRQWIRRAFKPFVTRYVALSPDLERYLIERIGVPKDRVEQVYNGVDVTKFTPAQSRVPIPGCPFVDPRLWLVGTVGRLDAVKDQGNLAAAFVEAVKRPDARERMRLVVVGDGDLRDDVDAILRAGNVRDLAWLAGERSDIPTVLQGLDAFVLPSRGEGVSNTILEAMASELPVVATNVGANAQLVIDGECGVIVPPGNREAIAEAILRYFDDKTLARAHARAGRARVVHLFSLDRMVERYHRLYSDLVHTHNPAGLSDTVAKPSRH
jgi:sugar transferase (PEP-CTERM/EpsH1 system associated)